MESRSWYEQKRELDRIAAMDDRKQNNRGGQNREARRRLAAIERAEAKRTAKNASRVTVDVDND